MNSSKQLKLGALMSYAIIIFNIIAGLFYTPWMVSSIGKSDYGLYVLVTTFLAYFISDYGLSIAINKTLSKYRDENKKEEIANTIGVAVKIYLVLDIIVSVILTVVYFNIESVFAKLTPAELEKFKAIFLIAAVMSVISFPFNIQRGIMMSHEYFVQTRVFDFISKLLVIIMTVLFLYLGLGLFSLVIAYGIAPLAVKIAQTVFLYKKGIRVNFRFWEWDVAKIILGVSVWMLLAMLAELLINNLAPTLIATFSGTEEIAVFGIGMVIAGYVRQFSIAINGMLLPKVSKLEVDQNNEGLQNITIQVVRIQLLVLGYITFGIVTTGNYFVDVWMGEGFEDSYFVAMLLTLPNLIINSQEVENTRLLVKDKVKYRAIMMMMTAVASIALSVVLIPKYGAIGSAMSIGIANFIFMVVGMNIVYRKALNLDIPRFLKVLLKFVGMFVAITIIMRLINPIININSRWLSFIVRAFIYTGLYAFAAIAFIMNDYEKNMIKGMINKVLRR